MARLPGWTEENDRSNSAWLETRPPEIRALVGRLPPDRLYRLKATDHRVYVYSYSEDGTVTVVVGGRFNAVAFERRVFGIAPGDLEECDPPGPDEPVGSFDLPEPLLKRLFVGEVDAACLVCRDMWTPGCEALAHPPYRINRGAK